MENTRIFMQLFTIILISTATLVPCYADVDIQNLFSPSGWMGDGEYGRDYVEFSEIATDNPHSPPDAIKITYSFGPKGWTGIYWLNEADNWGDNPGNNYSSENISRVTFWARGKIGNEVVEFKSGSIKNANKKYKDSYMATSGRVRLTKEWQQYEINLVGKDLSSVIGGFCWVASKDFNRSNTVTFYLDDIVFK